MPTDTELDALIKDFRVTQIRTNEGIRNFDSFANLRDFVAKEAEAWKRLPILNEPFRQILQLVDRAQKTDLNSARNSIQQLAQYLQSNRTPIVTHESSLGKFLIELSENDASLVNGAIAYISPNELQTSDLVRNLAGIVAAIVNRHPQIIGSPIASEVKACAEQREEINTFRNETEESIRSLKRNTEDWAEGARKQIEELTAQHSSDFKSAQQARDDAFNASHSQWKREMQATQAAYGEQLKLQEPAQYWTDLKSDYEDQGAKWTIFAVIDVAIIIGAAALVVYHPPEALTEQKSSFEGIRGAIIITLGFSMLIYLANLFVRIAVSAYHLARDAHERYQLTRVFLALIKDKSVDPKEREIVLASLFSRSDTGLLKHEASPTLPVPTIVDNLIRGGR